MNPLKLTLASNTTYGLIAFCNAFWAQRVKVEPKGGKAIEMSHAGGPMTPNKIISAAQQTFTTDNTGEVEVTIWYTDPRKGSPELSTVQYKEGRFETASYAWIASEDSGPNHNYSDTVVIINTPAGEAKKSELRS